MSTLFDNQKFSKKQSFVNSKDNSKKLSFSVSIQSNHDVNKHILTEIEQYINNLLINDYVNEDEAVENEKLQKQQEKEQKLLQKQKEKEDKQKEKQQKDKEAEVAKYNKQKQEELMKMKKQKCISFK